MIVDLGSGGDPERWKPNSIKLDLNYCDVVLKPNQTVEDLTPDERINKVIWCNVRKKLPLFNNSVDVMYATFSLSYMWEDVIDLVCIFGDLIRVMKQGAILQVVDYSHVLDPSTGDYVNQDPQIIDDQLKTALQVPYLRGEFEPEFVGYNREGDLPEYCWILRAHKY